MGFKEQMAADLAVFFNADENAEWVKYNGLDILAIVDIGEKENHSAPENRHKTAYAEIKAEDVPNPAVGDVISYKGKDWYFVEIATSDGFVHRIRLFSDQSAVILGR